MQALSGNKIVYRVKELLVFLHVVFDSIRFETDRGEPELDLDLENLDFNWTESGSSDEFEVLWGVWFVCSFVQSWKLELTNKTKQYAQHKDEVVHKKLEKDNKGKGDDL